MFNRVVIWGYPLHSHTHSYIHGGWFKAFKALGYDTYWFDDTHYPDGFDYNNTLFITEGYADKKIPLNNTSTYCVHICINPDKYLGHVKRLVDIRYLVDHIKDCNYNYVLDRSTCTEISRTMYYQKLHDNGGIAKHNNKPQSMEYECIYTCWATDLLPDEIKDEFIEDNNKIKENIIYWCGSYNDRNNPELLKFASEASKCGIKFVFNNPWSHPLSYEDVQRYTRKSFMSPDIRCSGDPNKSRLGETGTCHKSIGYIPCRILKAISYGLLGVTNSRHVYELLDKMVVYSDDEAQLFNDAIAKISDTELIKKQMKIVREKHTYINRARDLLETLSMK